MAAIDTRRIHMAKGGDPVPGAYVLYWMQAAVRAEHNHALEHAVHMANTLGAPVLAWACIVPDYPEAAARHHQVFHEGLVDAIEALHRRNIPVVAGVGDPVEQIQDVVGDARLVVTDDKPLYHQKGWLGRICNMAPCPVAVVETSVIVPVETALGKEAYSAASLRPHIMSLVSEFVQPVPESPVTIASMELEQSYGAAVRGVNDGVPGPMQGGHRQAMAVLRSFLASRLPAYDTCRSAPGAGCTSMISPYLHFGHISPCEVFLAAMGHSGPGVDAFVEQLVVRRELAANFVHYNGAYDSIGCLPNWARSTLDGHARDPREYEYAAHEFESCSTHDPYWNAAQRQMMETGHMDGYMRMYWGKKVIEWSATPEGAYRTMLALNNRYELDGRDPNGYAGVAWCFGKHDRPWKEREVFGMVRYMNDKGLMRKFEMAPYLERYGP